MRMILTTKKTKKEIEKIMKEKTLKFYMKNSKMQSNEECGNEKQMNATQTLILNIKKLLIVIIIVL
jgi:hypothetical protein